MAKIDEIRKQLASQNLISIEELQPKSIPEIIHNHSVRIENLELSMSGTKQSKVGYLSKYSAFYSKEYGWSKALQQMIDEGYHRIIFNQPINYHFETQGVDSEGLAYCVKVSNKSNIVFEGVTGHLITYDYGQDEIPNIFCFENCQGVTTKDLNFEGINQRVTTQPSTPLYTGSALFFRRCQNVKVEHINSKNVIYQVLAFNTTDVDISKTYNCHDYYNQPFQASTIPYAFIQCHSCYGYSIDNCVHYGGCRDGDIGVFGGGGERARVSNNRLMCYGYNDSSKYAYNVSQAICNDQGCTNAIIEGNFIEGYYFGIDMKADVRNCICTGNVIKGCKVSIADRRGESPTVYQTQFNHIINNMIILQDNFKGNEYLERGMYYLVGILCENRQGCHVENNTITLNLERNLSKFHPSLGIFFSQENINHDYLYPSTITNNHIIFTVGNIGTVLHAHGGSTMIHLQDVKNVNVSQNTFKGGSSVEYTGIKYQGACDSLTMLDNQFWHNGQSLYHEANTTLTNSKHNVKGYLKDQKIGMINELGTNGDMKEIITKDVSLVANVSTNLMNIGMTSGVYFLMVVKGCANHDGLKYVNATFGVSFDGSTVTCTKLEGALEGYSFGFHSASWGGTFYAKATTDSPLNRFKIEIIQGQYAIKDVNVNI